VKFASDNVTASANRRMAVFPNNPSHIQSVLCGAAEAA
jgi:hypothetical protein